MRGMSEHVEREKVFEGSLFAVERLTYETEDGERHERDVVRHPGAVTVVALTERGELVLIRNTRVAVGQALYEAPAGKLERGESPAECAARELEEETGYRVLGGADALEPIGTFYTTPGMTDELMRAFVARGLEKREQRLESGERIEVELVPAGRALELIDDGEIMDGKTIAAVLMAARKGLLGEGRADAPGAGA